MIAALYVETAGAYFGLPGVDRDEPRDARQYPGPHPIVAHPPCQRWGRFWHGSTRKPHQFKLGDDGGCFAAALDALERFGGVLEHPCDSHAWAAFGLNRPPRAGGWIEAGRPGMWTCCVYQGHYGHLAGKPTWLLAKADRGALPELRWGKVEQRLHPTALERHGYAKARRIGMMAMVGGKDKTRIRNATPDEFRQVLLGIAASHYGVEVSAPKPSAEGPKELWLQLHGDCHYFELNEPVDYTSDDVTWCWHQINSSDVRYVRADLAGVIPSGEKSDA